jgi:hypothetical protein
MGLLEYGHVKCVFGMVVGESLRCYETCWPGAWWILGEESSKNSRDLPMMHTVFAIVYFPSLNNVRERYARIKEI